MAENKSIPTQIVITRTKQNNWQTLGELQVYRKELLFECKTLELPWDDNKPYISCIPANHYPAILHISPQFGESVWIQKVPNRSEILIHRGNYNRDTEGCILVGDSFIDLDEDGHLDVNNSKSTIRKLLFVLEQPLFVNITQTI